jgi:hypothetical protein
MGHYKKGKRMEGKIKGRNLGKGNRRAGVLPVQRVVRPREGNRRAPSEDRLVNYSGALFESGLRGLTPRAP